MAVAPLLSAPLLLEPTTPADVLNKTLSFQVKDIVDLVMETLSRSDLTLFDADNKRVTLEGFQSHLYDVAENLMGGPLSDEMKRYKTTVIENLTSITPNQAAERFTTKQVPPPQRDENFYKTPFFDPQLTTLRSFRAGLKILRFGTDPKEADRYLGMFADDALYITSGTSELMVGKEAIREGNEKNMKIAPKLTYDLYYYFANRNSIRFGLTNNLYNGKKFDLSSINYLNVVSLLFTLNMDNYERSSSIKKVVLYMLAHPIETFLKLIGRGPEPVAAFPGDDVDPGVAPIPLVMDAFKLALKTLSERNIALVKKSELINPEDLLSRINEVAGILSGDELDSNEKILLSRMQRNLKQFNANAAVKDSAGVELNVDYANRPLLNPDANSIETIGFADKFLLKFSNLENKDQLADLFADESVYLNSGVNAAAGKEAIQSMLKNDCLRATPAIISVDEESQAINNFAISSMTYNRDGKTVKVCLEMFFDSQGKVTFLKEIAP